MSGDSTTSQRSTMLTEAETVHLMTRCVLNNGPEPNYATEKLLRAFKALVIALIRDLRVDPLRLIQVIDTERAAVDQGRGAPRWRWGQCPRCHAEAWIGTSGTALDLACSHGCGGFSIWSYLEAAYQWEQRNGTPFDRRTFDAKGRPADRPAHR